MSDTITGNPVSGEQWPIASGSNGDYCETGLEGNEEKKNKTRELK